MSRTILLVLAVLFVLTGMFRFIPALSTMVATSWYATLVIVIGVIGFAIAYNDKK